MSWRPCFVQQLDFGFSQKKVLDMDSRAKTEPRAISVFRLKCPALAMGNTEDTCIMKGSMFIQVRVFFYKQCFHNEIHAFLPERLQFS